MAELDLPVYELAVAVSTEPVSGGTTIFSSQVFRWDDQFSAKKDTY